MKRRFQDSQLYADFCDLAVMVLFTDCLAVLIFALIWKALTMHGHR